MKNKLLRLGIETALESKTDELHYQIKLGRMNRDFPKLSEVRETMANINELVDELEKLGDQ